MNEVVNRFLLARDKFMLLRQPRFTISACRKFAKNKERIQKFKETGDSQHIYQNKLDKACFQHGMAYGDLKDLPRRKVSDESTCKPNIIWLDKGSQFYNRSVKSFFQNNDIEMHSVHSGGKSVIAERFIRILKNTIYNYMTSISKNEFIDKLADIVNKYNNTYHSTISMKSADVKPSTFID